MKRLAAAFLLLGVAGAALAQYPKQGIRMVGQIPLSGFAGSPTSGAGCTGYVSPTGREYAIMGLRNSTAFVEVTDFSTPRIVGQITMPASTWHENAVTNGHAYLVTEAGGGVRIVDLANIDSNSLTQKTTFTGNNSTMAITNVHTVQAMGDYVYLNGSNRGFVILNVSNPAAPVEVGRWTTRYVHDSLIHQYTSGPYAGKTIAFLCCGGNGVYILDVTNPAAIVQLGNVSYIPSNGYCHSAVLSADGRYLLANDEFDERNSIVAKCTTHIINVENLSLPTYVGGFHNNEDIIDHNSRLRDNFLLLAAYRGGLRVYDAANPLSMRETGFFDTYPTAAGFSYDGAWGTYIFPSRTTVVADINRGLFVLDPTEAMNLGAPPLAQTLTRGSVVQGTLKDIRVQDAVSLTYQSSVSASMKNRSVLTEIRFETAYSPIQSIDLSFAARMIGLKSGEVIVEIKDQTTGTWTTVLRQPIGGGMLPFSITGLSPTNRVSATGSIDLRVGVYPRSKSSATSFQTAFDQLRVDARR